MLSIFPQLFTYSMIAPLILRIAAGLACFRIGWHQKHDWSGWHFAKIILILGGAGLLLGLFVQPLALILSLVFLGLFYRERHMDYLLLVAILLSLLLLGPGLWSIDLPL